MYIFGSKTLDSNVGNGNGNQRGFIRVCLYTTNPELVYLFNIARGIKQKRGWGEKIRGKLCIFLIFAPKLILPKCSLDGIFIFDKICPCSNVTS